MMSCDHENIYYLGSRTTDDPDHIEYFAVFWCTDCGSVIYDKADRHPDAETLPIEKGWKQPMFPTISPPTIPSPSTAPPTTPKMKSDERLMRILLEKMAKEIERKLPTIPIDNRTIINELEAMLKMGLPSSVAKKALIGKYVAAEDMPELENGKDNAPCGCGEPYLKQGKIWWCPKCKENFVVDV